MSETNGQAKFPANPFWDFSLRTYRQDGVAPACLRLQERHGLDVNILLFVCWCGIAGPGRLDGDAIRKIIDVVSPWHERHVRGLRQHRTDLKSDKLGAPEGLGESLRDQIKASELYAERIEQAMLYSLAAELETSSPQRDAAIAEANIRDFLSVIGAQMDDSDGLDVGLIVKAAQLRD